MLKIGVLLFIFGGLVNTILMKNNITGIPRDLVRLMTLMGLILIPIGIIRKFIKKTK